MPEKVFAVEGRVNFSRCPREAGEVWGRTCVQEPGSADVGVLRRQRWWGELMGSGHG